MYGYVYKTENNLNGRIYIGQHKGEAFDPEYHGSGKIIELAIKKYGPDSFTTSLLFTADTKDELDRLEIDTISDYKEKVGEKLYNIAKGGNGGDVFFYADEKTKSQFRDKMTEINRERCSTEEFKNAISRASSAKFADNKEREMQSERIKRAWLDPDLRAAQSARIKKSYEQKPKDASYMMKPCAIEINGVSMEFQSRKEMERFLKSEYGLTLSRSVANRLITEGRNGPRYQPLFKNKLGHLRGMKIYQTSKSVETMGDECTPVGREIGTRPKRKAEIEEIVHPS